MAITQKRAAPRLQGRPGQPVFYAYMDGPRRTLPGDTGDVSDLRGVTPAGVRTGVVWADGPTGKCLSGFAGGPATSTTYVDLGNSAALNPRGAFTYLAEVTPSSIVTGAWVIARDDASLGRAVSFGLCNLQVNGGALISFSTAFMNAGERAMIAVTGSPSAGVAYYLFNSLKAGVVGSAGWVAPASATGSTCIGRRTFASSNGGYTGVVHRAAVWDRALSAAEIAREYADPDYWTRPRKRVGAVLAGATGPRALYHFRRRRAA